MSGTNTYCKSLSGLQRGADWSSVMSIITSLHDVASSSFLLSTVVLKMAPLDLDKYVEIARQCKYLPENDLKVTITSGVIFFQSVSCVYYQFYRVYGPW